MCHIYNLSVMRNIHINYIMYINYIIWRWVCPSVHVCVHINRLGWKMDWWALNLLFVLHHFKSVYSLVTRSEIDDKPWDYISDWYVCMHYDNKWFDNLIWNTLCLLTAFLVGYFIAVIFLISMNHTWRNNFDMCNIYGAGEQLLIRFKNVCELYNLELLNLRAFKISVLYKSHIFQCMCKISCVEFQRVPLKFHTKYHTHTLKDVYFILEWKFKSF